MRSICLGIILMSVFNFSTLRAENLDEQKTNIVEKEYDIIVGVNGDYKTIQEAINAVPDMRKNETTIFIKNGTYKEKLILPASKNNVTFFGESRERTIITYDDYASKKNTFGEEIGTSGSSGFFVYGTSFKAINITFQNTAGQVGQAVAIRVDGDRASFYNCKFLGDQDTLYLHGDNSKQYYKDCYIEGTTDFIFGASTAIFEDCTIFSKKGGQYITAARTPIDKKHGFVFINCKLKSNKEKNTVFLGRPWRDYAKTVFVNCEMDAHIKKEGWHNWSRPEAESTTFYAEYQSTGLGANKEDRVSWSHKISAEQIEKEYSIQSILDGWIPTLD